jgi:hypothetical protein
MPDLARAFDALRQRDSAIVYYERYISMPNQQRTLADAFNLAAAYNASASCTRRRATSAAQWSGTSSSSSSGKTPIATGNRS